MARDALFQSEIALRLLGYPSRVLSVLLDLYGSVGLERKVTLGFSVRGQKGLQLGAGT